MEDKKDSNAKKENRDWWRKIKKESDEETIEDNATTEPQGKYVWVFQRCCEFKKYKYLLQIFLFSFDTVCYEECTRQQYLCQNYILIYISSLMPYCSTA